jgi:hypothetical protein
MVVNSSICISHVYNGDSCISLGGSPIFGCLPLIDQLVSDQNPLLDMTTKASIIDALIVSGVVDIHGIDQPNNTALSSSITPMNHHEWVQSLRVGFLLDTRDSIGCFFPSYIIGISIGDDNITRFLIRYCGVSVLRLICVPTLFASFSVLVCSLSLSL